MSSRWINTKFWDDAFVFDLSPTEKLLYLYLISSPHTNLCGVYELTMAHMAFHTGLNRQQVESALQKFDEKGKVKYESGYIFLKNATKHQSKSPKIITAIEREIQDLPENIVDFLKNIDWKGKKYNPIDSEAVEEVLNISFESFWNTYDKKVGSRLKIEKKWNKLKDKEREAIMEHLEKYIPTTPDKKFRKNPETYLNQRAWENEIIGAQQESFGDGSKW